jgi:hypothetical protein
MLESVAAEQQAWPDLPVSTDHDDEPVTDAVIAGPEWRALPGVAE